MFDWPTFLLFCITTTYTPGPNTILSMNYGRLLGFKKALPFVLGIFAGFALIMVMVSFSMQRLESLLPSILFFLKILGVVYLLYLAWTTLRSRTDFSLSVENKSLFSKAFFFQFLNPKVYLYGITAISGFILPHYKEGGDLLFFAILLALIALAGNLLWTSFGALFQKLFSKHEKIIRLIMALLLIYSAYKILF